MEFVIKKSRIVLNSRLTVSCMHNIFDKLTDKELVLYVKSGEIEALGFWLRDMKTR